MPGRVGIFRAERWTKRVNVAQRKGKDLRLQLPAHRQTGGLAEKALLVVDFLSVGGTPRHVHEIKSRYPKHLSGPFTIAAGNNWRVDVHESTRLKKVVDRAANLIADSSHGAERVCARAQVSDGAQIFERRAFLLQGIRCRIGRR